MSDDEIQVRVHNRDDDEEFRTLYLYFSGLEIVAVEDLYPENMEIPSFLLSLSAEHDRKLRKNDSVFILYQTIKTKTEFDCVICTESCKIGTEVAQLICDHCFHIKCISEWGKYKQDCPICRNPIEYKFR